MLVNTFYINTIIKRCRKTSPFVPYNGAKRDYFKSLKPQVRNALRKQYENYMQQIKMTIPFFHWFFKFRKPLKRIITLTIEQGIKSSPNNPNNKLFNQQNSNLNQEELNFNKNEIKFNQSLFSSTPGEVEVGETLEIKEVEQKK